MSDPGADLAGGGRQEFMAFRVAGQEVCVQIDAVREVRRTTPTARLPHAPTHMRGVINLRGAILPIVGMRERLGLPVAPTGSSGIVAIVDIGGKLLGLLVDEVSDIIVAPDDGISQAPLIDDESMRDLVKSIVTIGERVMGVVSV